jgi:hypothetical protein
MTTIYAENSMQMDSTRGPNGLLTKLDIRNRIAGALARLPVKRAADKAKISDRTMVRARSAERSLNAEDLILLMRDFDEVYEAVIEMAGRASSQSLSDDQRRAVRQALQLLSGDG